MKAANREREATVPRNTRPTKPAAREPTAREKALAFAKNVPKPEPKVKPQKEAPAREERKLTAMDAAQAELEELERQHEANRLAALSIQQGLLG